MHGMPSAVLGRERCFFYLSPTMPIQTYLWCLDAATLHNDSAEMNFLTQRQSYQVSNYLRLLS